MEGETHRNLICSNPFYLSTDGILFIIKDSSVQGRQMTQEEKDLYKCAEFENQVVSASGEKLGRGVGGAEAGVKITVMAK